MSYTPVDGPISTSYTDLADGDNSDVASVEVWLEALSDSVEFMRRRQLTYQEDALSEFPLAAILTPTRTVQSAGFRSDGRAVVPGLIDYAIPSGVSVWFPIDCLPYAAGITSVGVRIDPTNDALPTTNIGLQLWRVQRSTGVQTLIGSVVDPDVGAAYQAPHELVLSVATAVDLDNFSYTLAITAESGGDTDGYDLVGAPRITYTVSAMDIVR